MFGGGRSVLLDYMSQVKGGNFLNNMRTVSPGTWFVVKRAGRWQGKVKRSTDERSALRQATYLHSPGRRPAYPHRTSDPASVWGQIGPGATQAQMIQAVN